MNKDGFTTVELLLTMILVISIMATISSVTYTYRDRSSYEEELNELINYKNNVTKVIYDDILTNTASDKIVSMKSTGITNEYTLATSSSTNAYTLKIIDEPQKKGIAYGKTNKLVEYIIPGSDENLIDINGVNFPTLESNVYTFELSFYQRNLEKTFKIKFTIS